MATYVFTPSAVAAFAKVRFDTASGSNTPATVYPLDYAVAIPGATLTADAAGNLPTIESDSATLYQKTLDYRGVTVTATTTLTGVAQATGAPSGTPADLASNPAFTATYAGIGLGRIGTRHVPIGDSITIGGETQQKLVVSGNSGSIVTSWPSYAALLAGGKFRHVRNAGKSGDNAAQMLARFDTDVTPWAPTHVHISAGVNDSFQGVTPATYQANMRALVAKALAIGATVSLQTVTPVTTADTTQRTKIGQYNLWLRQYAAAKGIPLVDFHSLLVNPANGNLSSTYDSGDGTHPNEAGRLAMANLYATTLAPLLGTANIAQSRSNTDPTNLLTNGMFQTNTAGIGTGWTSASTPTGGSYARSIVTDSAVPGTNMQRLTNTGTTSGTNDVYQYITTGYSVGDVLSFSGIVTSPGGGLRAQVLMSFFAAGYSNVGYITLGCDSAVTRGAFEIVATVPPTATLLIEFHLQLQNGGTGNADWGNITVQNLTTSGALNNLT